MKDTYREIFTSGQVATLCQVSPRTVSKWIDTGRLKGFRLPGSQDRRVMRAHLVQFLKDNAMPLFGLDREESHKVLFVGTEAALVERLKALFAEDEPISLSLVGSDFAAGFQAAGFHPDTIIIDLALGLDSACRLARTIRQAEPYADCLILALTGEPAPATEELRRHGFSDALARSNSARLADCLRKQAA